MRVPPAPPAPARECPNVRRARLYDRMGSFAFVYVPADAGAPLEQWREDYEEGREVECLLERLKEHFTTKHPTVTPKQRQKHKERTAKELLRQKGLEKQKEEIPDRLLEAATSMQLVESIALLPCMRRHGCVGVTLYVDDAGSFKKLPVNSRATDLAHSCGMLDTVQHVVREPSTVGTDEEFERMDFLLSEVSSAAAWMRQAQEHQRRKMAQPTAQEALKQLTSVEKPQMVEITPAEEARQKGNAAYRKGEYRAAVEAYSLWLEHDCKAALAYSNRSMAHLQREDFAPALQDAEAALKLDGSLIKARYRRGMALEGLGRKEEALQEFCHILDRDPQNKAAAQKIEQLNT